MQSDDTSLPPKAHQAFLKRYPLLGDAWERMAQAGDDGPIDKRVARLLKLAVAIASGSEGAVHASVRKALHMGIAAAEIEQVVAIAAPTIGLPAAVAAHTWVRDVLEDAN